ncbi:MAG TPA: hypothetical protein VFX41_13185 [Actinomycetales bacterium]|nr:hypothetical protein [Actinomycetales bacterium]
MAASPPVTATTATQTPTATDGSGGGVSAAGESGGMQRDDTTSATNAEQDGGLPTGPVVAGAVVLALAGAGGWQMYRRRQAG